MTATMISATTIATIAMTIVIGIGTMTLGGGSRNRPVDNTVNAVKPAPKRNYEDAYSKVLQGPCLAHSNSGHTMGDCKGLKSIYLSDRRKRQRGGDKDGNKNDHWDDKRPDEEDKTEEDRDKDPRHAYKDPDRRVCSIFGGKVALKTSDKGSLPPDLSWPSTTQTKRLPTPSIKLVAPAHCVQQS
jgi:hypothetical protein